MHKRVARLIFSLVAIAALTLAACGNDDDGPGGGQALSDEEFCDLLDDLDDDADLFDDADSLAVFAGIARQAPDPEMRESMLALAEVAEQLEGLDDDDPEAMGIAFSLAFDPEFMGHMETIETYLSEVCGIDTGMDDDWDADFGGMGDDGDDPWDDDAAESGDDDWTPSDRTAMEDLSAGEIRERLSDAFDEFAPGNSGSGVGIFPMAGMTAVEVTVYDPDSIEELALCDAVNTVVVSLTDDNEVVVLVKVDDDTVAERTPGGSCRPV